MIEFQSQLHFQEKQVPDLNESMWVVKNLREHSDFIAQTAARHGVDARAIAAATVIENMSDLNRPLQDELGGNWWQDLLATSANTLISSDEILYFICIVALGKLVKTQPLDRRRFLRLALVGAVSLMSVVMTRGYSTPSAATVEIPSIVAEFVDHKSNGLVQLIARRSSEGIWVERSIGITALKPFEIGRILNDPSVMIINPLTGQEIDRELWQRILASHNNAPLLSDIVGGPVSIWLGALLSNSEWSYELAAARMELAKNMYPSYREQYTIDWCGVSPQLPVYEELSERDQQQYLVWAAIIGKGYPHTLLRNGKVSGFAASFESEYVDKVHPLNVDWPIAQLLKLGVIQ